MRRKQLAMTAVHAIGLVVLLAFSFVPDARALNESELLTRKIRTTTIKSESIDQILGRLTSDYKIPVGIELGDEKLTPRREITLALPERNLKAFLDSVIEKDSRFTWKLEGGVIHVWPISGRDTLLATLLDEKISHFAIIGDVCRCGIYNDIMSLPEISSKLVIAGVKPLTFLGPGSWTKLSKETFFNESNLTLRELLDRIVLKTEIKGWVISRWGKNSEFISLKS